MMLVPSLSERDVNLAQYAESCAFMVGFGAIMIWENLFQLSLDILMI